MSKEEIGAVAMLDALAVRSLSIDDSKNFLKSRDIIIEKLKEKKEALVSLIRKHDPMLENFPSPEITTFGDTMVLTWKCPQEAESSVELILSPLFVWLRPIVRIALENNVLIRGAIAVGKYIKDETTIIGPAIGDAAFWYEQAQWIGVIATPNCGIHLSMIHESTLDVGTTDLFFVQHEVPLKNNTNPKMWILSWPFEYKENPVDNNSPYNRGTFLNDLKKFPIPFGTEPKFYNTIAFFDWFTAHAKFTKSK